MDHFDTVFQDEAVIYCDGFTWNSTVQDCVRPSKEPLKKCNFNHGDFCGWSQSHQMKNNSFTRLL